MPIALARKIAALGPLAALRHPGYRLLTGAVAPGMVAMQMSSVALGYLVYELTGSATALGLIGLGWGLPMLVLSLVGGVVADRFPRRMILLGSQGLVGSASLLAAVLLVTGAIQAWHLFLVALIQGTSFAFNMPARQAMIADLVEPDDLGSAIALNNAVLNLTRVIGPPIAGVLIALPLIGINGTFIIMASTYVVVLLMLSRLPAVSGPARARTRSGWGDLKEGLGHIAHSRALLALLALAFAPMFFGMPYQLLLPVFALGILDAGSQGLGILGMASGLGALVGSVGISFVANTPRRQFVQLVLGILFGLTLTAFAFSGSLPVAAGSLAVVGACSAAYMSLNNTLIMQITPRELHGRVMSVYMMTFSLMPLASLPVARLADIVGAPLTVGAMGLLLVAAIVVVNLWSARSIRRQALADRPASAD